MLRTVHARLKADLVPACAKACPTASIQFGDLVQLRVRARERVPALHQRGVTEAYLYGASAEEQPGTGGLNAFFLLLDKPEKYNLPPEPVAPARKIGRSWASMPLGAMGLAALALLATGAR